MPSSTWIYVSVMMCFLPGCKVVEDVKEVGINVAVGAKDILGKASKTLGAETRKAGSAGQDAYNQLSQKIDPDARKIRALISKKLGREDWANEEVISLDLSGAGISRIGYLSELTHIHALVLSNNSVSDLAPLYELPRLRILILNENKKLSDDKIQKFIEANPDCLVVYSSEHLPESDLGSKKLGSFWHRGDKAKIRDRIATKLGKPPKELTEEDLFKVYSLDLSGSGVVDLKALNLLKNLKALDITGCRISSLSPVQFLDLKLLIALDNDALVKAGLGEFIASDSQCQVVHLEHYYAGIVTSKRTVRTNRFNSGLASSRFLSDIIRSKDSQLILERLKIDPSFSTQEIEYKLKGKTYLSVPNTKSKVYRVARGSTGIRDIRLLAYMPNLTYIDLDWNDITDITPLGKCKELKTLYLRGSPIGDIKPLLDLPKLEKVWIDEDLLPAFDIFELNRLLSKNN